MIKLTIFNRLTISILDKSILRIKLDTSLLPFSFDLRLGLLYSVLPWYNNVKYEEYYGKSHRKIDILCPILFDLSLFIDC